MHLSTTEMDYMIRRIGERLPAGEIMLHKKGGVYVNAGLTIDTDTGFCRVSYRRVGGPGFNAIDEARIIFSRPVAEFTEDRFTMLGGHAI